MLLLKVIGAVLAVGVLIVLGMVAISTVQALWARYVR